MAKEVSLSQTFIHKTTTHEYHIRWTRIGATTSPPLIVIHGTPWSSVVWQNIATSLSTRYNIYLYDHPGFALSPPPHRLVDTGSPDQNKDHGKVELDASLVLRAEASAALFAHWNLPAPPHIVAHDNGGLVSLRLLLSHSIQFRRLCLIDVVALGPFGSAVLQAHRRERGGVPCLSSESR